MQQYTTAGLACSDCSGAAGSASDGVAHAFSCKQCRVVSMELVAHAAAEWAFLLLSHRLEVLQACSVQAQGQRGCLSLQGT